MRISIIIPAFNEEKLIGETLAAVRCASAAFDRLGWETELIVCDNNSKDRTSELARAAGAKVVFEPMNQISRARNRGAAEATGDWLIFVDADSRPTEGLFAEVAAEITKGRCLAGGSLVQMEDGARMGRTITKLWNLISQTMRWAAGSFIFCEKSAFRECGGFSQEIFAAEELDLSRRLKRLARERGRTMTILTRNPLWTSGRKMHLYTPAEHLGFLCRVILLPRRTLSNREACQVWYDGRR